MLSKCRVSGLHAIAVQGSEYLYQVYVPSNQVYAPLVKLLYPNVSRCDRKSLSTMCLASSNCRTLAIVGTSNLASSPARALSQKRVCEHLMIFEMSVLEATIVAVELILVIRGKYRQSFFHNTSNVTANPLRHQSMRCITEAILSFGHYGPYFLQKSAS